MAFHIHILYVTYTPYNQKAFYSTKESKQYEIYQNTSNRMLKGEPDLYLNNLDKLY